MMSEKKQQKNGRCQFLGHFFVVVVVVGRAADRVVLVYLVSLYKLCFIIL